jgi:hypothetical protein
MLSLDTLLFLRDLLGQVGLNAGADSFDEAALRIINVRRELREAINAAEADADSD